MGNAIVTGASSGLGRELAVLLAARGESVVAVARSADALEELAATTPRVTPLVADLSTPEGRDATAERLAEADILVNNAGFGASGRFDAMGVQLVDRMVGVNVLALTDLTARCLPGMLARRAGRILNIASTAAFQPGPKMAVYFATKAYVLSLTEALAEELRGTGVTATAFCPGAFTSGFQAVAGTDGIRLLKGRHLPDSAAMARAALAAMDRGATVSVPGTFNKLGSIAPRFAPRPFVRRMVHWVQSEG